jgi:hypothetical protein
MMPSFALKSCLTHKLTLLEIKKIYTNTCYCGRPARYYVYCKKHAPNKIKGLYAQREELEHDALIDYKHTPNDVQNPSTLPQKLKLVGMNGADTLVFAKIRNGKDIGLIFAKVQKKEVKE